MTGMRVLALSLLVACVQAATSNELEDIESDPRIFFSNQTSITVSLSSMIYGVFALVALALLAAFVSYFLFGENGGDQYSGYSSHSSSGYGSGRAAQSPYSHLFDNLSVLDWISLAEEVYRDFDGTSMDCQKRIICQLHQNENSWGSTARRMNSAFSYVQYLELLNLPADVRVLLDEYVQAAEQGRSSANDCTQIFPSCKFDVVQLIDKFSTN